MGIPIGQWSGADATDRLRETMLELGTKTERQTRQLVVLTWVLVILTAVLVALTLVLLTRSPA